MRLKTNLENKILLMKKRLHKWEIGVRVCLQSFKLQRRRMFVVIKFNLTHQMHQLSKKIYFYQIKAPWMVAIKVLELNIHLTWFQKAKVCCILAMRVQETIWINKIITIIKKNWLELSNQSSKFLNVFILKQFLLQKN